MLFESVLRIYLKFDVCAGGCEPEGDGEGWEGELWEVQAALLTGRHHRLPHYQVPADLFLNSELYNIDSPLSMTESHTKTENILSFEYMDENKKDFLGIWVL